MVTFGITASHNSDFNRECLGRLTLVDLPPEIRSRIYYFVLEDKHVRLQFTHVHIIADECDDRRKFECDNRSCKPDQKLANIRTTGLTTFLQLLATCRTIRNDLAMFPLVLEVNEMDVLHYDAFQDFLDERLHFARLAIAHIHVEASKHFDHVVFNKSNFPNLQTLTVDGPEYEETELSWDSFEMRLAPGEQEWQLIDRLRGLPGRFYKTKADALNWYNIPYKFSSQYSSRDHAAYSHRFLTHTNFVDVGDELMSAHNMAKRLQQTRQELLQARHEYDDSIETSTIEAHRRRRDFKLFCKSRILITDRGVAGSDIVVTWNYDTAEVVECTVNHVWISNIHSPTDIIHYDLQTVLDTDVGSQIRHFSS